MARVFKHQPTPAISSTHQLRYDSKSKPGVQHVATVNISVHCGCEGFTARQNCWHITEAMQTVGRGMVEATAAMKKVKR